MTSQEFDDALDQWLQSGEADLEGASVETAPAEIRAAARQSTARRLRLASWLWLHRLTACRRAPAPPEDFAERVVAQLRESAPLSAATDEPAPWSRLGWLTALAALLFVSAAIVGVRRQPPERAVIAYAQDGLAGSVDDATVAWRSLANRLADSVRLTDADGRPSTQVAALRPLADWAQTKRGASELQRVVRDSPNSIAAGGKSLGASIQPITDSAVGAFGFLWPSSTNDAEKPSI